MINENCLRVRFQLLVLECPTVLKFKSIIFTYCRLSVLLKKLYQNEPSSQPFCLVD